jgi:hypothetical protein
MKDYSSGKDSCPDEKVKRNMIGKCVPMFKEKMAASGYH